MRWRRFEAASVVRCRHQAAEPRRAIICAATTTRSRIAKCSRANGRSCGRHATASARACSIGSRRTQNVDEPTRARPAARPQRRFSRRETSSHSFVVAPERGKASSFSACSAQSTGAGQASVVLAPQRQQVIDLGRDGLHERTDGERMPSARTLPQRAVVIVDEAGQIGGRQLLDLIRLVRGSRRTTDSLRRHAAARAS